MGHYTQLIQGKRYYIYAFMGADFSQTDIGREIGVHKGTVCRELRCNREKKGYRPKQARAMAVHRHTNASKFVKLTPPVVAMIEELIWEDCSLERVSGFLSRTQHLRMSHETIYQHILNEKAKEGTLHRHLSLCHKKRRKRYDAHDSRLQL